ncbi:hypothetical protein ACIRLA_18840 [Streptomyces sp. NPDC102364]|uniref:hypothetical protein n=1 Tax=Streptomyces sp. NPDC102364 TaxID=3366161 RepID=UPI003813ABCD
MTSAPSAATAHSTPAPTHTMSYVPKTSRTAPPTYATEPAPTWCAALTQPKTTGAAEPKWARASTGQTTPV